MFEKSRQQSREYRDLMKSYEEKFVNKINSKGDKMDKSTLLWICYGAALTALILAIIYLINFFARIF